MTIVTEIVNAIVSAVTGLLTGLGGGIVEMFNTLILDSEGKITVFAVWALVFIGVGFAFGLVRKLMSKV